MTVFLLREIVPEAFYFPGQGDQFFLSRPSFREPVIILGKHKFKKLLALCISGIGALLFRIYGMIKLDILTLDLKGVGLALLMALLMLYLGGPVLGSFYIFVMIYFLVLSAIVTHIGTKYKKKIRQYQKTRGIKNVVANGLGPLIFVILAHFNAFGLSGTVYTFTFMASVAAVTADKFSSELGVLDGKPTSIVTLKRVEKGTSGGVTLFGIGAGVLGAFLIAIVSALVFFLFEPTIFACPSSGCSSVPALLVLLVVAACIGGFIGTISDSYLGYFEEKGIGNKYTSNFVCSMFGATAGFLLVVLI